MGLPGVCIQEHPDWTQFTEPSTYRWSVRARGWIRHGGGAEAEKRRGAPAGALGPSGMSRGGENSSTAWRMRLEENHPAGKSNSFCVDGCSEQARRALGGISGGGRCIVPGASHYHPTD